MRLRRTLVFLPFVLAMFACEEGHVSKYPVPGPSYVFYCEPDYATREFVLGHIYSGNRAKVTSEMDLLGVDLYIEGCKVNGADGLLVIVRQGKHSASGNTFVDDCIRSLGDSNAAYIWVHAGHVEVNDTAWKLGPTPRAVEIKRSMKW